MGAWQEKFLFITSYTTFGPEGGADVRATRARTAELVLPHKAFKEYQRQTADNGLSLCTYPCSPLCSTNKSTGKNDLKAWHSHIHIFPTEVTAQFRQSTKWAQHARHRETLQGVMRPYRHLAQSLTYI